MASKRFQGLIQHSFALQLPERREPFYGQTNLERVAERFNGARFSAQPVATTIGGLTEHSPLAESKLTTLESLQARFLLPDLCGHVERLPAAFSWAEQKCMKGSDHYSEPRLIFADRYDDGQNLSINDFLVSQYACPKSREPVSQLLLELMAHMRSRLFGFRIANRFVNVMLPHAILRPTRATKGDHAWFVQPLVSFVRGGRDRGRLRATYSLSLFLVPVKKPNQEDTKADARTISISEIGEMINAGWGFAAAPSKGSVEKFRVYGPLFDYLKSLTRFDLRSMSVVSDQGESIDCATGETRHCGTLRQTVERIAFGVGLLLAQGKEGCFDLASAQLIGNNIVMSLGSARVSSVIVVDDHLKARKVKKPIRDEPFPGRLRPLMETLAEPIRSPDCDDDKKGQRYRLDRPFVDDDLYVVGVLPANRCMVVASRGCAQYGIRESALMQAGSVAYMTIGAATAIGTLREFDRRLERLEGAEDPREIARIDAEIAADLAEIYDLDITRESYRAIYSRFRKRLGITRDYKTLQSKMQTLYRATSTFHEHQEERRLAWLTAAIVALSVLILIGTVIVAGKGG